MPNTQPQPEPQRPRDHATATVTGLRCVLIGDVHVYHLWPAPWHLLSKRILGQANLWVNRRSRLRMDRLPDLVDRIRSLQPDLMLGTGDLTTTALPAEFALARRTLEPILQDTPAMLVPGNHDRYTYTSHRVRRFEQYFTLHTAAQWPSHRMIAHGVHLIGLDPTRPTPLNASGRFDPPQLAALRELLDELPETDRLVVVCHYPIGTPADHEDEPASHGLRDAADLIRILNRSNPTLYLHGHIHRPWCFRHPIARNVTAVDAGAPTLTSNHYPHGQGFWSIDITPDEWTLTHHVRQVDGQWAELPQKL